LNRFALRAALVLGLGGTGAAQAQSGSELAARAISIACGSPASETPLGRAELAEALLAAYAVPGSRVAQSLIDRRLRDGSATATVTADDLKQEALRLVIDPTPLGADANRIRSSRSFLASELTSRDSLIGDVLRYHGPGPFSFEEGAGDLVCAGAAEETPDRLPRLAVRGTVDELAEPDKADVSGALEATYGRQRQTDADGERTVTRSVSVRGAAGVRLVPDIDGLIAYGEYALSHVRRRTRLAATPPANDGRGDDINALELGLLGTTAVGPVRIVGRLGTTLDFETGARRLRGTLVLRPAVATGIGSTGVRLCNVGGYSDNFLGLAMEARCSATAELDLSHVLRKGTAMFDDSDELVALGGTIGLELRPRLLRNVPQDGLVANLLYRYQPMISGRAPNIDRFEASIKHRWWAGGLAVDLGVTYADGIERKSLIDENRLSVALGLLY
jgi:hypothetical protein